MFKLKVLILYLVQVLFSDVNAQTLYERDECFLKNTTNIGECRYAIECPSFIRISENEVALRNSRYQFATCGFSGINQIICCPELSNPTSVTTQTPFTTQRGRRPTPSVTPIVTVRTPIRGTSGNPLRKSIRQCQIYSSMVNDMNIIPIATQILNGVNAQRNEFPHMAALGYLKDNVIEYICGGSLISDRYVLTAGHCIQTQDGEPVRVKMGTIDIEDSGVIGTVESTLVHPLYNRSSRYNDIALIRLSASVEFFGYIYPACLYTRLENPTTQMIATGFGQTSRQRDSTSRILLKANFEAVNPTDCNTEYSKPTDNLRLPNGINTRSQICVINRNVNNSDTCQGDSGGPLQVKNTNDNLYSIIGITSFGRSCGVPVPSVDTRVSNYLDWIESVVWP